jgi:hypothetical protein
MMRTSPTAPERRASLGPNNGELPARQGSVFRGAIEARQVLECGWLATAFRPPDAPARTDRPVRSLPSESGGSAPLRRTHSKTLRDLARDGEIRSVTPPESPRASAPQPSGLRTPRSRRGDEADSPGRAPLATGKVTAEWQLRL